MKTTVLKNSATVSYLFLVCCANIIAADENETAKNRIKCEQISREIRCIDEQQNTLNEIPETTKVLIVQHVTSDPQSSKNFTNFFKFDKTFLLKRQNLESLSASSELFSQTNTWYTSLLLPNLKELHLTLNSSGNLRFDFFCSFPNLQKLIIGDSIRSDILSFHCGANNSCCSNLQSVRIHQRFYSPDYIYRIALEAFRHMSSLRVLHLENLGIIFPPAQPPTDFPKLTELKLFERSVSFFPGNFSFLLENIQSLQLYVKNGDDDLLNQLRFLKRLRVFRLINYETESLDFDFNKLAQLRELELRSGRIASVSSNSFKNTTNLKSLNLSNNVISVLTNKDESGNVKNIFTSEGMPNLKYLNLSFNKIRDVDYSMIPERLQVLDLSHNLLNSISDNMTSCTNHSLKQIYADWTSIENLEDVCFPTSIEVISLKNTKISRIPRETFSSLINLKELLLDGNQLINVDRFALSSRYKRYVAISFEFTFNVSDCCQQYKMEERSRPPCNGHRKLIRNIATVLFKHREVDHVCQYARMCEGPISELCKTRCSDIRNTTTVSDCGSLMLTEVPLILPNDSKVIYMDDNNLTTVDFDQILQHYTDVNVLYMNNSNLQKIDMRERRFSNVSTSLKEIHLEDNVLEFLPKYFFIKLRNFASLHLQRNLFKQFHIVIDKPLTLKELHLENNSISEFVVENKFQIEFGIKTVYLQSNNLTNITRSFCRYNISTLHLEENKITDLDLNCVPTCYLINIHLQNNLLTRLNQSSFYFLPTLHYLNLEGNEIRQIGNKAFSDLERLKKLDLRRNRIDKMDKEMFYEVKNLEELHLEYNCLVDVPSMVFKDLGKLQRLHLNRNHITTLPADLFRNNKELKELHLEQNSIETIDLSLFDRLPNLVSLYLNGNNISEIISSPPLDLPSLVELYLQENRLKVLNGKEFKGLNNVKKLFLHSNEIRHIFKDTFEDMINLEILTLHSNKLKQPMIWNFGLSQRIKDITIHQNPIDCECQYLKELTGFLLKNSFIANRLEIKCVWNENEHYYSDQWDDILLQSCESNKVIVGLSISIGLLLLIVFVSVLLYKYRLAIQVIFYSRFKVRFFYDEAKDQGKQFHAFVAYSYDDREFVANQLVPRLEDYRLCLHDRNFTIGVFIQENIINAINNSCCTLIIFSNSFMNSEWCKYEFRTAYERTIKDRWRRILVVVLEDVDPDSLDDEMQMYLSTTTYLRWGDKLFWERLYFSLPSLGDNDIERNSQHQDMPLQTFSR